MLELQVVDVDCHNAKCSFLMIGFVLNGTCNLIAGYVRETHLGRQSQCYHMYIGGQLLECGLFCQFWM